MSTATIWELPEHSVELLAWIEAGEEVAISAHGRIIARLIPVKEVVATPAENPVETKVDWTTSAAFTMDKSKIPMLTSEQVAAVLEENRGNW